MESISILQSTLIRRVRKFSLWQPLAARDFRLLWLGQSVSLFGDQFYLIALPWLTLHLTGSALALGTVLMVAGGTRAVFQLLGGALSDSVSPHVLMVVSSVVRAVVTGLIAVVVLLDVTQLWHLYTLSFIFGMVDAVFFPAYMAVIPSLVITEHLPAGNALLRGTGRLMSLMGPAIAGIVISTAGLTVAFAIDTLTFVFAAVMIGLMKKSDRRADAPVEEVSAPSQRRGRLKGLFASIGEGLRYAWSEPVIRALFLFICAIEFSYAGPASVGIASLAKTRFEAGGGASALGWMMSSLGGGMLIGMLSAGSITGRRRRGPVLIGGAIAIALGLGLLGFATHLLMACAILVLLGIGGGLGNILIMAWIQSRTRKGMLGRVISLLMLGMSVLEPLSFALAGIIVTLNLKAVFVASGGFLLIASIFAMASPALRTSD
ncbi:MAG TPA: MFS transporter [Blastocatellia bacterium]|nr:MFS transporter [Blastocatellia bacterium]